MEVENEAAPALTWEVPSKVVPSMKVTLPVGDGAEVATWGTIVADNVTAPP